MGVAYATPQSQEVSGLVYASVPLRDTWFSTSPKKTEILPIQEWGAEINFVGRSLTRAISLRLPKRGGVTEQLGASRIVGTIPHELGQPDGEPVDSKFVLQGVLPSCVKQALLSITRIDDQDPYESVLRVQTNCSSCPRGKTGECSLMPTSIALIEV